MTDPRDTGLPEGLGNDLSDRSGLYDDSDSGLTDTPIGRAGPDVTTPGAVPTVSGGQSDHGTTGTTFGTDVSDDQTL